MKVISRHTSKNGLLNVKVLFFVGVGHLASCLSSWDIRLVVVRS